jgi:hypothetical protein
MLKDTLFALLRHREDIYMLLIDQWIDSAIPPEIWGQKVKRSRHHAAYETKVNVYFRDGHSIKLS